MPLIAIIILLINIDTMIQSKYDKCINSEKAISEVLHKGDAVFQVKYLHNAPVKCLNPGFPIMQIKSIKNKLNGWIQIIHTNSNQSKYRIFVDSYNSKDPFYSREPEFYDAPLWTITPHSSLTYWKAHTYAVYETNINKEIKVIAGIEWGFLIPNGSILPQLIKPRLMSLKECREDFNFFLAHYKNFEILF